MVTSAAERVNSSEYSLFVIITGCTVKGGNKEHSI